MKADYNFYYETQPALNSLKANTIISKTPGGVHTFESAAFER